ncbi:hypothetical protein BC828DRAFT_409125 [Blastocladiella britannica]|nr:hypothetical protein BC828DRAFT_409125 [Blastocladiella britannica]
MRAFTLLATIALIGSFLASPAVSQADWDSFEYAEFAVEPEHQHHHKNGKIHGKHHGKAHGTHHIKPHHGKPHHIHHGKHHAKGAHPHHHKPASATAPAASYDDDEYDGLCR